MKILTIDIGTSSLRAAVFDADAAILSRCQIRYRPAFGAEGAVTQSPADWRDALVAACRVLAPYGADAVALTAQRSSVIPAAADGTALSDAIMWQDTRNRALCRQLSGAGEQIRRLAGVDLNTVYSGGKMAWLRQQEPALYEAAAHLFVIPDYLLFQMTGRHVTDHTYGSRSMLMDLRLREWSEALLAIFEIDRDKLGTLIAPGSVAGDLSPRFAAMTGLRPGIPVVSSGGDQQCGALGQGVFRPGDVSVNLGTGAFLLAPTDCVPEPLPEGLLCGASALPDGYMLEASMLSCGAAVDWFLRTFCPGGDVSCLSRALRESPAAARGVIALPYLYGRAYPDWNSAARAAFVGLRGESRREDLLRALLESLCLEVLRAVQALPQRPERIRLGGGLSRTVEICQLLADVTGLEILVSDDSDATLRGAWMNAARALCFDGDIDRAWGVARPTAGALYRPHPEMRAVYDALLEKSDRLYAAAGGEPEVETNG